jgi:hypothetical protein
MKQPRELLEQASDMLEQAGSMGSGVRARHIQEQAGLIIQLARAVMELEQLELDIEDDGEPYEIGGYDDEAQRIPDGHND